MADLWVGAGKAYARVADAVAAAKSGDTIYVTAGTYTNDFSTIAKDLRIVGVGGKAHFTATTQIPNGKAIFITRADVTFENIEFSGAKVTDKNGAGIRYEGGDLVVKNSYFHDNQNGILAAKSAGGTIAIQGSEFARNGYGDGQTHGLYVNDIASLTVVDSYFHDTKVGHHIKSRAAFTEVRDSRLDDGSGNSSYSIDLPNGGGAKIVGNTLIQGANAGNKYMLHYGGEGTPKAGAVLIADNDFVNYRAAGATAVYNQTSKTLELKNNALVGVAQEAQGPVSSSGAVKGVMGTSGADVIAGDAAANWLAGAGGNDQLSGGSGDDVLMGGSGDDVLNGGVGVDTAVFAGTAASYSVTTANGEVRVKALSGGDGTDRLIGVEKIAFADGLVNAPATSGTAAPSGGNAAPVATNDSASTQQGKSVVINVLANDSDPNGDPLSLSGVVGAPAHGAASVANGKVSYTPAAGFTGSDNFTYRATDGKGGYDDAVVTVKVDPLATATPAPSQQTYDGKTIVGRPDYENLYGSAKADFIQGMGGGDALFGFAGKDRLDGGAGNDKLKGGDGADTLLGGAGNDILWGEGGTDKLDGGSGGDTLHGGAGADLFAFGPGCGADAIADFGAGADKIDLQAFDIGGFAALKALCSQNGSAVTVDLPGADSLKVLNKQIADLASDHFLL